jgi:hypothetical protein
VSFPFGILEHDPFNAYNGNSSRTITSFLDTLSFVCYVSASSNLAVFVLTTSCIYFYYSQGVPIRHVLNRNPIFPRSDNWRMIPNLLRFFCGSV